MKPEIGHYLFASCAGEDYGRIVGVGTDANGKPAIDIEVFSLDDILSDRGEDTELGFENSLVRAELPDGVRLILRGVQWAQPRAEAYPDHIICNTPGDGCYRCTQLFMLHDLPWNEWCKRENENRQPPKCPTCKGEMAEQPGRRVTFPPMEILGQVVDGGEGIEYVPPVCPYCSGAKAS